MRSVEGSPGINETLCFSPAQHEAWGRGRDDNPSTWRQRVRSSKASSATKHFREKLRLSETLSKNPYMKSWNGVFNIANQISIAFYDSFSLLISIHQGPTLSSRYQTQLRGPLLLFIWIRGSNCLNSGKVLCARSCQTTASDRCLLW